LQLHDLAQALPGILIAALLPGYALATLLVPRWRAWERLATAPGLSVGFIGALGLSLRLVHIPFERLTVFPCIALLVVAASFRRARTRSEAAHALPWWVPVPALVAGMVGAVVFAVALSGQVLPPDWDPRVHAALAASIARTHDVLPLFPIPLQHSAFTIARPGFEATATLVSWLGGPPPAMAMAPIVVASLVLLPLSLALLAVEATGSVALAVVVPLFAAGLAFPSFQAILGRFPQVVDSTLIAPMIVAAMRVLRGRHVLDNALLLGAATASIWVVHGLEVLTALVVGGVLLAWTAFRAVRVSPSLTLIRMASAAAAVAGGALLVTVITRRPHVPPQVPPEPSAFPPLPVVKGPVHWHELLLHIGQTNLTSPAAVALLGIGVLALLIQRRMLWVLATEIVVVLVMADDFYWRHLARLWTAVFPWSDQDRLLGLQYWIVPFILGAGLLAVLQGMRALSRERRLQFWASVAAIAVVLIAVLAHGPLDRLWMRVFSSPTVGLFPLGIFDALSQLTPWRLTFIEVGAALLVAWLALSRRLSLPASLRTRLGSAAAGLDVAGAAVAIVALISLGLGARAELHQYRNNVVSRGLVTPADVTVLTRMSAMLPPHTLVLTDGLDDAGVYVTALTDLTPLVPNTSEMGTLSLPLVVALANACADPAAAARAVQKADVVFVGAHRYPNSYAPWDLRCIAGLPDVRLITSAPWQGTEAAAFAVTHIAA